MAKRLTKDAKNQLQLEGFEIIKSIIAFCNHLFDYAIPENVPTDLGTATGLIHGALIDIANMDTAADDMLAALFRKEEE